MSFDETRIPVELWQRIFKEYCSALDISISSNDGPWLLSHVSHNWRAVVLSTPPLWSTFSVPFPESFDTEKTRREHGGYGPLARTYNANLYHRVSLARLENILLRSKSFPLSIQCRVSMRHWDLDHILLPLYRLLINHCNRWQHISFVDITEKFLAIFTEQRALWPPSRQSHPFPHLLSIQFDSLSPRSAYKVFDYPAPQLTSITLPAYDHKISTLFPKSRIRHCSVSQVTGQTVTPMLARIRSTVEDLVLAHAGTAKPTPNWAIPPEFPRMLKLSCCGGFGTLFKHILAPALEDLTTSLGYVLHIPPVVEMCERSNILGILKRLKLEQASTSDLNQLSPLLRSLPSLEYLDISFWVPIAPPEWPSIVIADAVTGIVALLGSHSDLCDGQDSLDICPRLGHLSLSEYANRGIGGIKLGRVADMMALRRGGRLATGCLPLRKFSMGFGDWKAEDPALDRLRGLRDDGLDIDFWTGDSRNVESPRF